MSNTAQASGELAVFDFDHTLYDGDSFTDFLKWRIVRSPWRVLLALLVAPLAAPMIAFLPTRRRGISAFVWVATLGLHRRRDLNDLIAAYVRCNQDEIRKKLLPIALQVFHQHRQAGHTVIVATGAPPALARAILAFVAHQDVPVIGTEVGPKFGAVGALRHCHHEMKVRMIREAGFTQPIAYAYSDSSADLPLLVAAQKPVVVNPKAAAVAIFRKKLPPATPVLNWGCPGRAGEPVG